MALVLWPFTFLFLLWGVVSRHLHNDLHICQGNTTLEGEETKRLRTDHWQSGWIKNDWKSPSHVPHLYGSNDTLCSRPLRQSNPWSWWAHDIGMQDRRGIPCCCGAEKFIMENGDLDLGNWTRRLEWREGSLLERAAYNLSVATSKFGNQQQNDQQLNVKVFNTSYVWDLFDTTVPKHISSLKIINDGSDWPFC